MTDLNPGFTFDLGPGSGEVQAPWEFEGALAQAEAPAPHSTTIDEKIRKRVALGNGKAPSRSKNAPASHSDDSEESEEESEKEDSDSDAPLPGEEDGDSSDDEDQVEEESDEEIEEESDEAGEEESDAGESEMEQGDDSDDEQKAPSSEDEQEQAAPAKAGKRKTQQGVEQATAAPKRNKGNQDGYFAATPDGTTFKAKSFAELNLSKPLVKACQALGYTHPTPIQAACIPLALTGRDISGSAVTGSGKTAAFVLPLLERLLHRNRRFSAIYVLVLTPVRELAVQIHSMTQKLAQFTDIRAALLVGGLSLQAQAATLRTSPEIIVGTPGRVIDHVRNTQSFGLEDLQALILDEADRLLEMGFAAEIQEIVRLAPRKRQTMLFSATMTEEVKKLASVSLQRPVRLAADAAATAPKQLTQEVLRLKGAEAGKKEAVLMALCSRTLASGRTIIFFSTKQRAHRAKILFGLASLPPAAELHGDMTQAARLASLESFRRGEAAFLLATDVAARGLDILGVETVVNYDAPRELPTYLHRIGRTARAGATGRSVTFAEDGDRALLKAVVKGTGAELAHRTVPVAAVNEWQDRVERMQDDFHDVIREEREERHLRKAEMEAQKASNLVEHEAEIMARPPRTWFQSEREKREAASAAREERGPMNAKQQKNHDKYARKQEMKLKARQEAAEQKRNSTLMEETAGLSSKVKAIKSREKALRESGVSGARAGKMAASMLSGVKKTAKTKKGKDALFGGDGLGGSMAPAAPRTKVYAGGAKSTKAPAPKTSKGLSPVELARAKRSGKGHHGFKSKARHKRR